MDRYDYDLVRQRSGVWKTLRDGDFEEEDVWDVLRDRKATSGPKFNKSFSSSSFSSSSSISVPRNIPSASTILIPRGNSSNISSGSSSDSSQELKIVQQSAPVNIPDWSKIRKKNSKFDDDDGGREDHVHHDYDDDFNGVENFSGGGGDGDEEINDDDNVDVVNGKYNYKVPPHEYLARRLARTHLSPFSVFEGVGRTLKGRDLKKVRNAILTKTGFLE